MLKQVLGQHIAYWEKGIEKQIQQKKAEEIGLKLNTGMNLNKNEHKEI